MANPPPKPPPPPDSQVNAYQRVVNGKVVKVNAYAKRPTTSTKAAAAVRKRPGRPRMAGQPGTYSAGRDIPGQGTRILKEVVPPAFQQKGKPDAPKRPDA